MALQAKVAKIFFAAVLTDRTNSISKRTQLKSYKPSEG
jgi:hypothetical protein